MKIGILTFFRVQNFGANLQALSTFFALKKRGHEPIFIYYESDEMSWTFGQFTTDNAQKHEHYNFVDKYLPQTPICRDVDDINCIIKNEGIEAIVVGSDAVLQHSPFLSRIKRGRIRPIYLRKVTPEGMFPNPFWGYGINDEIPMSIMSASSQNSSFSLFSKRLCRKMADSLSRMKYISVRDNWTKKMLDTIFGHDANFPVTPDPVFAFNKNVSGIIPGKTDIVNRHKLPDKYILFCLPSQCINEETLLEFKIRFSNLEKECVAFPLPNGMKFQHPFDYEVALPLNPLDWYAIIKNASGYIGCNMHPIVVCLHNSVPCYSIDNWGRRNFFGKAVRDDSSKVKDILTIFGIEDNHAYIDRGLCNISVDDVVRKIERFPIENIKKQANEYETIYKKMMDDICEALKVEK